MTLQTPKKSLADVIKHLTQNARTISVFVFLVMLAFSFALTGCSSDYHFDHEALSLGQVDPENPGTETPDPPTTPGAPDPGPTNSISDNVRTFKPALAIRASGCISCHASVHSNFITDFGYGGDGNGRDFFFGGKNEPVNNHYGNYFAGAQVSNGKFFDAGSSWSLIDVMDGKVMIPHDVKFPNEGKFGAQAGKSLTDYLLRELKRLHPEYTDAKVGTYRKLYIGAPTPDTILATTAKLSVILSDAAGKPRVWYKRDDKNAAASNAALGLKISANGNFLENGGAEFSCAGDVVVDGTLVLRNLKVRSGAKGCRLYVTESVFVQGAITYVDSEKNSNLQITSARSINLGLGSHPNAGEIHGVCPNYGNGSIGCRYLHVGGSTQPPVRYPSNLTSRQQAQLVIDDFRKTTDVTDALIHGVGKDAAAKRTIPFGRLLLNAPYVHSRYMGDFDGVVIAEVSLFALGNFRFRYDPVFDAVPVLPLLEGKDILQIEE